MNNANQEYKSETISEEIYNKHHISISKVSALRSDGSRRDAFVVSHITPIAYALKKKYPNRHKGYNGYCGTAHNIEQAEAYVATIKSRIDVKAKAKQDRLAEKAKARQEFVNPYKVGDILNSCWGYDQTNREFYQVVAVGNRSLKLRRIGCESVRTTSWCSDEVSPIKDKFIKDEVHRVNIVVWGTGGYSIKSPIYGNLHKYEGGTLNRSWGH
jgi:hypothetical protein